MQKKVLVVEDERTTAKVAQQQLERAGFDVYLAENGKEGLDSVKKNDFDLIITDVEMPVMDGVDFYKALKKNEKYLDIPIIVITSSEIFKNAFSKLGVKGFLAKPLTGKNLLGKANEVLGIPLDVQDRAQVMLFGNDTDVIDQMEELLHKCHCGVYVPQNGIELIGKALRMVPNIIVIDVLEADIPAYELIKSLRCFSRLRDTHIIIYSYLTPEQLGDSDKTMNLKRVNEACDDAGVSKNIGRFTRMTFLDSLREFGI